MRASLAACALVFVGCASLDQFDVPLSAEATIPGLLNTLPGVGFPRGFPGGAEISREIKNQGVEPGDVKSARFTAGALRVVAPEGSNLSYVKSVELFVEAEGLKRRRVASQTEAAFANRPARVELLLDDVELAPYVTAPAMKFEPVIELAERPSSDLTVALDLTLHVDLTLID